MFIGAFPIVRCVLAAVLLTVPAVSAWARGDAAVSVSRAPQEVPAPASALADQIDALLADRFAAADAMASRDARRQALQTLNQFAKLTVEGLIEASPSGEVRALMDARLRPVLARHQGNIAAALAALGERPSAHAAPSRQGGLPHVAAAP